MKSDLFTKIKNKKKSILVGLATLLAVAASGVGTAAYAFPGHHQKVPYSTVSAPAKHTLGLYFAGEKISSVTVETDHGVKEYEIVFKSGTKIDIDENGQWEEVTVRGAEFPMKMLPEAISSYITKNYPQSKVIKADRDSKGYEVKLAGGLELEFNAAGQFIKVDR